MQYHCKHNHHVEQAPPKILLSYIVSVTKGCTCVLLINKTKECLVTTADTISRRSQAFRNDVLMINDEGIRINNNNHYKIEPKLRLSIFLFLF